MSNTDKPGADAAGDVHDRIRAEAATLRTSGKPGIRNPRDVPEVNKLLLAARAALGAAVPTSIEYKGRPYWLRVGLQAIHIEIFSDPVSARPMVEAAAMTSEEFGHVPGH
jgi:hypothetical protein